MSQQVKVRLRKGEWEIEISCTEDKVQQVVESAVAGLSAAITHSIGEPNDTQSEQHRIIQRGTSTCRSLLMDLYSEGWFSEARSLGQVHDELSRKGYHYDRTAVAHNLADLVRENILTRKGSTGSFAYIQKKPPSS